VDGLDLKNKSNDSGGAIFSQGDAQNKNILVFNGIAIFTGNESTYGNGGGAIHTRYSNLTFGEKVYFEGNKSEKDGGAIYAYRSDLMLFAEEATFVNNKSKNDGGAIYSRGDRGSNNILMFYKKTNFTGNKSTDNGGGAIHAYYSDLVFLEEVEFKNNSSFSIGGAIVIEGNWQHRAYVAFNRLAIFENNSSRRGGAIYLFGDVDMIFRSGLRLTGNATEKEGSGAIYMQGTSRDCMAKVTIEQENSSIPTEFKENTSDNGRGHNAFYLQQYAELNFAAKEGDIDLYDRIYGANRDMFTNISTVAVNINQGAGWFNVKRGGSIANVDLTNRGNLNLAESQVAVRALNFINSGRIVFGIFPENKKCSGIQAENITLEGDTTLEISMAPGIYKNGYHYDTMISENAIKKSGNISMVFLQELPRGLRARIKVWDQFYRLFIEEDSKNNNENWFN
jgi:predicted outer membrane repeat protein